MLLLAGTPLGNPGDASSRLIEALGSADVVAAEDTRKLRALATSLEVRLTGSLVSFYEEVESRRLPELLDAIRDDRTVLLLTDAGMPSVSDPGYRMVTACIAADLPVGCLPGPSAVTTALAVSGLATQQFCFDGFAPRKPGERAKWLRRLAAEPRTTVFFESPHRLGATLRDAAETLGRDRAAVVCRELTKTYEEIRRGELGELSEWAAQGVRGEITVVLAGAPEAPVDMDELVDEVRQRVADGERLKTVAAEIADAAGVSKKELYDTALAARGR